MSKNTLTLFLETIYREEQADKNGTDYKRTRRNKIFFLKVKKNYIWNEF